VINFINPRAELQQHNNKITKLKTLTLCKWGCLWNTPSADESRRCTSSKSFKEVAMTRKKRVSIHLSHSKPSCMKALLTGMDKRWRERKKTHMAVRFKL